MLYNGRGQAELVLASPNHPDLHNVGSSARRSTPGHEHAVKFGAGRRLCVACMRATPRHSSMRVTGDVYGSLLRAVDEGVTTALEQRFAKFSRTNRGLEPGV